LLTASRRGTREGSDVGGSILKDVEKKLSREVVMPGWADNIDNLSLEDLKDAVSTVKDMKILDKLMDDYEDKIQSGDVNDMDEARSKKLDILESRFNQLMGGGLE